MTTVNQQGMIAKKNTTVAKKQNFASFVKSDVVSDSIKKTLGSDVAKSEFVSSIISAVSTNPALQECEYSTIINCGLLGTALKLSPSPQLGHYYMVPFKDTKNNRTNATFQLGWKGYYQLALRSGQYKKLNAVIVKEGELVSYDPFTDEIELKAIMDEKERAKAKTIGYYAYFEMINGFKKAMYWSKEKMEHHAITYSKGYASKKGYTFWEKNFDEMALKTMYRQLISKYGIMSIDLQKAYTNDMTIPQSNDESKQPVYFDDSDVIEGEYDSVTGEIVE